MMERMQVMVRKASVKEESLKQELLEESEIASPERSSLGGGGLEPARGSLRQRESSLRVLVPTQARCVVLDRLFLVLIVTFASLHVSRLRCFSPQGQGGPANTDQCIVFTMRVHASFWR